MNKYPTRIALYRKIEVARKQLPSLQEEENFRALLCAEFDTQSRKNMSVKELTRLVDILAGFGAKYTASSKKKPQKRALGAKRKDFLEIADTMPFFRERRQILAIWRKLGYSLAGLDTRVQRAFGVKAFFWLTDGEHVKTLLNDLQRREKAFDKKQTAN